MMPMRLHVTADMIETRRDYVVKGDCALLVFTDDGTEIQIHLDEVVLDDFLRSAVPRLRDWQRENDVRLGQERMREMGQTSVDDFV